MKGAEIVQRRGAIYGIRNLLAVSPEMQELARSKTIRSLVEPILGGACFAVRGTFFDKVPGANWNLSWHQDSVIAVRNRADVDGFESWSLKSGVLQVQPPHEILGQMIALRIHLDDCRADNGCLRVLPGSHAHGWLDDEIEKWKAQVKEVRCEVGCGGVIAMRPLVLHASSPAESPGHRRVIHLEFAARPLPGDLQWHIQVGSSSSSTPTLNIGL